VYLKNADPTMGGFINFPLPAGPYLEFKQERIDVDQFAGLPWHKALAYVGQEHIVSQFDLRPGHYMLGNVSGEAQVIGAFLVKRN
jgi:hypothetical protein